MLRTKQLVELSTYSKTSQLGRKVRNESIRKVGTKYSRTNQFSCLGAECIVTIVQLSLFLVLKYGTDVVPNLQTVVWLGLPESFVGARGGGGVGWWRRQMLIQK